MTDDSSVYENEYANSIWTWPVFMFEHQVMSYSVDALFIPLYYLITEEQYNEWKYGLKEGLDQITEKTFIVTVVPSATLAAMASVPYSVFSLIVTIIGTGAEATYYGVESLITGQDINDLVKKQK